MYDYWCCCGISNEAGNGDGPSGSREPNTPTPLQRQHQQFLGDVSAVVLDLGTVQVDDNELLPEGINIDHLNTFAAMYIFHCEVGFFKNVLALLLLLQFIHMSVTLVSNV